MTTHNPKETLSMLSRKSKTLSILLILTATPTLSWAGTFDCAVYDKKINNGLRPDARQGDVPVEAATLAKAVKQTRIDYPVWKNAKRYKIECRASEEE